MISGMLDRRSRRIFGAALLIFAAAGGPAWAIKIVSYNLLNYPDEAANRDPAFRTILTDLQPDIVIAQEVEGVNGANAFRNNVLNVVNPGAWVEDQHFVCGDTDASLFYRTAVITTTGVGSDRAMTIATAPRLTPRWKLRLAGYNSSATEFYAYGCHLKASDTPADATDRQTAANLIRANANGFPTGTRFIVVGDMNFYRMSSEPGYTSFTGSQADNDGRLVDVLNPTLVMQEWHNSNTYRFMHTQSPRASNPPWSDGGVTGGMDDRFDFILISTQLNTGSGLSYVSGTYRAVGQDGNRCCNGQVNSPLPNGDVSNDVANALWAAADHLPVLLQLRSPPNVIVSTNSLDYGTVIVGADVTRNLTVSNPAPAPGETLTYTYTSEPPGYISGPGGVQSRTAGASANDTITLNTLSSGVKNLSPALTLSTNSPEGATIQVGVTGTVLDHAVPSLDENSQVLVGPLDFGTHSPGGFSDEYVAIYNVGWNPLQAAGEIVELIVTGPDAWRFSAIDASSVYLDEFPSYITMRFDSTGATPGTYTATAEFVITDQSDLQGATSLPSVFVEMTAGIPGVKGDFNFNAIVDCTDIPTMVAVLLNPAGATPQQRDIADMNSDTQNDGRDIQPFVNALQCP